MPRRAAIPETPGQLGMSMTTGTVKLGMLMLEMFEMLGMLGPLLTLPVFALILYMSFKEPGKFHK